MATKIEIEELRQKLKENKHFKLANALSDNDKDISSSEILEGYAKSKLVHALSKKEHTASSDVTAGITELSTIILEAPAPAAIGRSLVRVVNTLKESVKIRLPRRGKAVSTARKNLSTSQGERNSFLTITPDKEIEASEEWDDNYLEDADHDVAAREAAELSRSHDEAETAKIIAELEAVPASVLAGGGNVSAITPGTFTYNDMVNLWGKVGSENRTATVIAMHTDQLTNLFKDPDFKDQHILGEFLDIKRGMFGSTILGMQVFASTLIPAGHVYALDADMVLMWVLRRDKLAKAWEIPPSKNAMQISSRYGSGIGRPEGFARMINA